MMQTVWFITGTSSGLGNALAKTLSDKKENRVYGFSRREGPAIQGFFQVNMDLSDKSSLLAYEFPDLTNVERVILVNNAATLGEMEHSGHLDSERMFNDYVLNVITPHILSNKFLLAYDTSGIEKVIINISSGAANSAYDGWSVYCASKAAIQMQAEVMQLEQNLGNTSTRIYAIEPGVLDTPMQSELRNTNPKGFSRKQKFVSLYEGNALANPRLAAEELIKIALQPTYLNQVVHRLSL